METQEISVQQVTIVLGRPGDRSNVTRTAAFSVNLWPKRAIVS